MTNALRRIRWRKRLPCVVAGFADVQAQKRAQSATLGQYAIQLCFRWPSTGIYSYDHLRDLPVWRVRRAT
jgi:DUF971 family protein